MSFVVAPVRYVTLGFCGVNRFIIAITAPWDRSPLEQLLYLTVDEVVTVSVLH